MANDSNETKTTLLAEIQTLASRSGRANGSEAAMEYASAANQLAEAYAWLTSPNMSH